MEIRGLLSAPICVDQYEDVRSKSTHFLLAPGHELSEVERVMKRPHKRLVVVEKFDVIVARTVRRLDPRTQSA